MEYKVGDKVKVKSLEWFEKNCDLDFLNKELRYFSKKRSYYCGKIVTIDYSYNDGDYTIKEDKETFFWQKWMFEDPRQNVKEILRGKYEI